jgi:hypothetical protein
MKAIPFFMLLAATAALTACSSPPPVPATPDGSSRVPVNTPGRVQALQERVAADRALLSENNLLKAQVEVLQSKLNEVTNIVREVLVLPVAQKQPTHPTPPSAPAPTAPTSEPVRPVDKLGSLKLPNGAYEVSNSGVVIRVFHDYARTDFEPSVEVARALREATRNADTVLVRGRTDSDTVDAVNRLIAIERAMKARAWLIDNGVEASKITTRFSSAGMFLSDNSTQSGRALNRRVEIDVRYGTPAAAQPKA